MPFNGAGTFNRLYSWVTDAANGIKIRADRMDAETNGIATGLSDCVTRDGQSPATANLPMGGFKHTNVGAASGPADYATAGQMVNSGLNYATGVGGTANAVTVTTTIAPAALVAGQIVMWKATASVLAGGVTLNRSVLGAKAVQQFGAALPANAWLINDIVICEYDGTQYQLIWPLRSFSAASLTGTLPNAVFPATLPAASGVNLTALNATQLTSGTVPNAAFPATLPALSGANLTALNASNLASGTVPDARFPATLPVLSGVNLTALNASNLASGTVAAARLPLPAAATLGGVKSLAAVAHKFLTSIGTDGLPVAATPVLADISDAGTAAGESTGTAGHTLGFNDGANTYSALQTFSAGANLTPAATPATNAIGYLGTPQVIANAAHPIVMTDAGKQIYHSDATPRTYTIPANASVAFPIGTKIEIFNDNGAAALTIAITTDTLRWLPTGGTGSRTLAANGSAIISKIAATVWAITGVNLT